MKNGIIKIGLLFFCMATLTIEANAQRTRKPATNANTTKPKKKTDTQKPSVNSPYGDIPIEKAPPAEGGYSDSIPKKSLRQDGAFEKKIASERTPLPYEHLRADDALFAEKVWREVDLREKMNQSFRFRAEDDNGDQRFVSILMKAVRSGEAVAFDAADDRFTTPLSKDQVEQLTAGGTPDTHAVYKVDDPTLIEKYVISTASFDPDAIQKIRIKEEWVFDRESSRMVVRIIGIAPLKTSYLPNGKERGFVPMFWVYYPDIRPILSKYEVYNPKNMGNNRMTWEEVFESRMFSSYITKSTLDNPFNKTIRQVIKDPILALLEGDNIKERIFNYEQDLWSY